VGLTVERVARAIFSCDLFKDRSFEELPSSLQEHWRVVARAAIKAMKEPDDPSGDDSGFLPAGMSPTNSVYIFCKYKEHGIGDIKATLYESRLVNVLSSYKDKFDVSEEIETLKYRLPMGINEGTMLSQSWSGFGLDVVPLDGVTEDLKEDMTGHPVYIFNTHADDVGDSIKATLDRSRLLWVLSLYEDLGFDVGFETKALKLRLSTDVSEGGGIAEGGHYNLSHGRGGIHLDVVRLS
jgi:hypothetical protein